MVIDNILETLVMDTQFGIEQKFEITEINVKLREHQAEIKYLHHVLDTNGEQGISREKSFVIRNTEDIYYAEGEVMEDEEISDGTQIKVAGVAAFDNYATILNINAGILPLIKAAIEAREGLI